MVFNSKLSHPLRALIVHKVPECSEHINTAGTALVAADGQDLTCHFGYNNYLGGASKFLDTSSLIG